MYFWDEIFGTVSKSCEEECFNEPALLDLNIISFPVFEFLTFYFWRSYMFCWLPAARPLVLLMCLVFGATVSMKSLDIKFPFRVFWNCCYDLLCEWRPTYDADVFVLILMKPLLFLVSLMADPNVAVWAYAAAIPAAPCELRSIGLLPNLRTFMEVSCGVLLL